MGKSHSVRNYNTLNCWLEEGILTNWSTICLPFCMIERRMNWGESTMFWIYNSHRELELISLNSIVKTTNYKMLPAHHDFILTNHCLLYSLHFWLQLLVWDTFEKKMIMFFSNSNKERNEQISVTLTASMLVSWRERGWNQLGRDTNGEWEIVVLHFMLNNEL